MNEYRGKRIDIILDKLNTEQKAELCSGRGNWFFRGLPQHGIKEIMVCDGPHGLRKMTAKDMIGELEKSETATCFPPAAGLAASWNRELIKQVGEIIAEEAEEEEVSVVLGPGANIKRSPLCGRNFEYFSEDPFLSGELSSAMIKGIQKNGIGCSLKHFAVNNQEENRMTIDAIVDERSLREIYLAGFERAVKQSAPWTVMCSYNRLNGIYLSDNEYMLTKILREEWGFDGIVISDWGACNDRIEALKAGMEIEMPYSGRYNIETIIDAVKTKKLSERVLDTAASRILNILLKANDKLESTGDKKHGINFDAHHLTARKAAAESMVLLKNSNNILPLKPGQKLLIAGEFAVNPRYQGAGSSRINPPKVENFLDSIRLDFPDADYSKGYSLNYPGEHINRKLIRKAAASAADSELIIVLAGLPDEYESEGFDRDDMKLPDSHNELIDALLKTGKPVIVCLSNGSPVEMPWNNEASAVIECYLGGQAGAAALTDLLTGRENPSGKLAESFPLRLEDNPSFSWFPGGPAAVEYREGIFVGYRYYDKSALQVLYPFGHGLSYTVFEYSRLSINRQEINNTENEESFAVNVSLNVRNTGDCRGKETVQLYIAGDGRNQFHRPVKELKGFTKIELEKGEDAQVDFQLDFRSFALYDPILARWRVPAGTYTIMTASSSADIRLSADIVVTGRIDVEKITSDISEYNSLAEHPELIHSISDKSFMTELGRELSPQPQPPKEWSRTSTLTEFSSTFIGKIILKQTLKLMSQYSDNNENSAGMFEAVARSMPLRALAQLSNNTINIEMIDAFILMGSGRFFRGTAGLLSAFKKLKHEQAMDQTKQD